MGFKFTVSRFVGLVFLVAALANGANAAVAERYVQLHGSTPAALNADGLRGLNGDGLPRQRLGGTDAQPQIVRNGGFDWSDAGIGAVGGLGFAMVGGALLIGARRMRRTRVAV